MEVREGATQPTDDIIFQRIGVSIPVIPSNHKFESHSAPLQALAVSNRFGLTFVAHPEGFCVAKTAEILCLAKNMKDNTGKASAVRDLSIVDVPLAGVRILALSNDSLVLAACVEGSVHFFAVHDLVQKANMRPFHSKLFHEAQCVKEFIWSSVLENTFVALLSEGVLVGGKIESSFICIEEKVIAVDWSANGQHLAVVIDNNELIILSSEFEKKFHVPLPVQLQSGCADDDSKTHVDSIKWVRSDSIIIGCVGVNEDGEEAEYLVYLLTSRSGDLSQEPIDAEILAFNPLFSSIDGLILPPKSGPYLLVSYLHVWELVLIANRRNIDDHIVLLGWMQANGKKEPFSLEIVSDKWLPRIELQENGDENLMVGIAMDQTSMNSKISIPLDDGGLKELPPCPVLLCMTIEGKLNLFSFARIAEEWHVSELVFPASNDPIPCSKALGVIDKEVSKIRGGSCVDAQNSEVEKSSCTTSDSMVMGTIKPEVNAKMLQVDKQESEMVKLGEYKIFSQQKANDAVEPLLEQKSTSITVRTKEVDLYPERLQIDKQEYKMGEGEGFNTFQLQKASDVTKATSSEKASVNTLGTLEEDINTKISQVFKQENEMPKAENSNKIQLQKITDVAKIVHAEKATSVDNKIHEKEDIRNLSGILTTVPSTILQNAPPKSSPFELSASPFACSSASASGKGALQVGASQKFGSVSVRTNESEIANSGMLSCQNVAGKTNLIMPSKTRVPGKVSFQKDMPGNLPMGSFGTGSFGIMQSSGPLSNSTTSSLKSASSLSSTASGGLVAIEGNRETNHRKSVAGDFDSHNVPAATVPSNLLKTDWSTRVSSAIALEDSQGKMAQGNIRKSSEKSLKLLGSRLSGISDTEADFSRELEKVRNMAKEIDDLFSYIEGGSMVLKAGNPSFRKHLVMSIEDGIKNLSKNCKETKESIEQQLLDVQNLYDNTMQVIAWKVYMQSLVKQAADSTYQDLRDRQKLNPELDIKRQCIIKMDQRLKHQILELERHLQTLEINMFEEVNDATRRGPQQLRNARQLKSLQSLYNTVNSQLVVAEQLAACLSQQMEALNISSTVEKPGKTSNTTKDSLFRLIGLSPDEGCFRTPDLKEKAQGPWALQNSAYSPAYSTSNEGPIQKLSRTHMSEESETVRRRRDPIYSEWASVGITKTTVKRVSQTETSRGTRNKSLTEPTESKISQLWESPSSQALSGGRSQAIEPSKRRGRNLDIQRNTEKISADTISSEPSPSPGSFFNQSNYNMQSSAKVLTQAATVASRSPTAENRSYLPSANLLGDKPIQNNTSFSTLSSATHFLDSKPRSFGLTVGTQYEDFSGFKPSTMQNTFGSMVEISVDLSKPKSSKGSVLEENASSVEMGSNVFPNTKQLFIVETKPAHGDLGMKPSESNKIASVSVTASAQFDETSADFSPLQESSLSVPTAESIKPPATGVPSSFSVVASATASAIQAESYAGKALLFGMARVDATAGQNVAVLSGASLSSVEARAVSNPLQEAHVTAATGSKTGTMNVQAQLPFASKPANMLSNEASLQTKPLPVSMPSLSTSGVQCKAVSSGPTSTATKITSSPIAQSNRSWVPAHPDHSLEVAATASLVQSQSEVIKPSHHFLSSFSTASSGQTFAASSVASSNSSSTLASISQVPPLVSASPQPKPLFVGFSTAPPGASIPAFSFPSSTTSGFGQFSAPVLGLSGTGSQVSAAANTSMAGFSSSSSTPLSSEQSHSASSVGQGTVMRSSEQNTFSATFSGSSTFGSQISGAPNTSASIGFSSSSSTPLVPQQNQAASSFGRSIGIASPERKTFSSSLVNAPTFEQHVPVGSSLEITPVDSNEEDMEEATSQMTDTNFGGFSGFGLGSATPSAPKSNPFGGPLITGQTSPAFSMNVPTGELFRPASFSLPAAPPSPQSSGNLFSSSFGGGGGLSPAPATVSSFGQPAQPGPGQQALGSALGSFGQSRQLGFGSGFGAGFGSPSSALGSGFTTAASGGGFAAAASGGGFAAATSGGGFAAVAGGGGFAGAANAAGARFAGVGTGGGFQSFSGNQGSAFSAFGSSSPGLPNAPQNLFTQMRK